MSTDVMQPAGSGAVINNGTIVVGVRVTGKTEKRYPEINHYVASGTLVERLTDRFNASYYN